MTEEEKKAIERIERLVQYFEDWEQKVIVVPEDKKYFDSILNLIQKQDTEINKLNNVIDKMAEKINQAYFDENNMYLWFEKEICNKKENGKYDYKDIGTRKKRIKEYFMKEE